MTRQTLDFTPLSRASDPSTSHLAAAEVRHRLGRLIRAVVDVVSASDEPLTANEIAERAYDRAWVKGTRESLRKRCREAGERKCSVTGKL